MDPMAFSLASESTETTPVPSLATGTAPQPPATANGADTTTASGSLAKAASDQKDDKANKTVRFHERRLSMLSYANTVGKATDDDVEIKDPDRTTSLQVSWARRAKIKDEIRRKVGVEFSPVAIDTFLDNTQAIDLILKGIAYEEPLPENPIGNDPREIAKPEIKLMSWGKWRETALPRDAGTREHHSAIDVLYEEPQPLWASSRRSLLRIPRLSGAAKVESRQHMHNKEDGPMSAPGVLPSRLRINSVPAKRLLDSLCNDELAFSSETDPLIIVRPFKVLTIYEDQITNKMAEIEQIYDERLKRAGTAKAHLKQKDENVEAARRFESHNNNIGTVDVDGNAKIQPKNDNTQEAEFLAQRRFPRDMIFFTGTEWSELTLSEIKRPLMTFAVLFVSSTSSYDLSGSTSKINRLQSISAIFGISFPLNLSCLRRTRISRKSFGR